MRDHDPPNKINHKFRFSVKSGHESESSFFGDSAVGELAYW
jgi:hypothetical protein